MNYPIRLAELADIVAITALIELSAKKLGGEFYNTKTINSALKGAFGVDTQLIEDKCYYVIEDNKKLIACGGWSFRKTLFGSDSNNIRDPKKLDTKHHAAKIRAFFIHPSYARQGLGKLILAKCEDKAKVYGFHKAQLMSTLSGVAFYQKNGYAGKQYVMHKMQDNTEIKFLPMNKELT